MTLTLHDPADPAAAATPANNPLPMGLGPTYPSPFDSCSPGALYSQLFYLDLRAVSPSSASRVRPGTCGGPCLPPTSPTPPTSVGTLSAPHIVTHTILINNLGSTEGAQTLALKPSDFYIKVSSAFSSVQAQKLSIISILTSVQAQNFSISSAFTSVQAQNLSISSAITSVQV